MAEIRYNPFLDDYVIINSNRAKRPDMQKDFCAFCPGSGKVPDEGYTVMRYPNDFPCMSQDPPVPDDVDNNFFRLIPSYGRCEVILYSPDHNATVSSLTDENMHELALLWQEIYRDFTSDEKIKYVMIFENRGEAVGTTMIHPHGQVYGYGHMPLRIREKIRAMERYREENGSCLYCDFLRAEQDFGGRIIFENEYFSVFLPYFTEYPYGVYVFTKEHIASLDEMDEKMLFVLGETVKEVAGMYDSLFGYTFPYMMCMHQKPNGEEHRNTDWHFHIEFFPPMRGETSVKYNASSETGAWAHCNPTKPEEKAAELRAAHERYLKTKHGSEEDL